jgi:hypothetical protein
MASYVAGTTAPEAPDRVMAVTDMAVGSPTTKAAVFRRSERDEGPWMRREGRGECSFQEGAWPASTGVHGVHSATRSGAVGGGINFLDARVNNRGPRDSGHRGRRRKQRGERDTR